jgi:hypothetical protein
LNSLPVDGAQAATNDVYVYIGVDGLAWSTVQEAIAQGAFNGPSWRTAKLATIFPGTSDASWTRALHTEKLDGYELEYYDPTSDALIHDGLLGGARHVLPTVSESLSFEARYLDAFDYRANGYTSSIVAYSSVWASAGETLDNLFFTLEGHIQTSDVFTAYMLEIDLLGHLGSAEECARLLLDLANRIEAFRSAHPDKRMHFTLLSDHGMDFAQIPRDRFIDLRDELPKVGVAAVEHLAGRDPTSEVYAVPVIHTRVTYVALHTDQRIAAEVARRASSLESIDLAFGRIDPPESAPMGSDWYGIWSEGQLSAWYGYVPSTSEYILPEEVDLSRFGIPSSLAGARISDEALFERTKLAEYPDLFYRVRTALDTTGVNHPAQVLLSFRQGWCSIGFKLPDAIDLFGPGYHGLAKDVATFGVLVTDERDLPAVIRADAFLDLFPRAKKHLVDRGLELVDGDRDAARPFL